VFKINPYIMVKQLNDLVPFISQRVPNAKKLLTLHLGNDEKLMQLYDAFVINVFENEDAVLSFLGNRWSSTIFKNYAKVLHKNLLDLIVFLEPTSSEYNDEIERALIKIMQVKILANNNKHASTYELSKELLDMGFSSERPFWVYDASNFLINVLLITGSDKIKDIEYYNSLSIKFKKFILLDEKSVFYLMKVYGHLRKNRGYSKGLIDLIDKSENELGVHDDKIPNYNFNFSYYNLKSLKYYLSGMYKESYQEICNHVNYLKLRSFKVKYQLLAVYTYLILTCRMLKSHEEADQVFEQAKIGAPPGSFNWFALYQSAFLSYLSSNNYTKALSIYIEILHSRFYLYKLSADDKEIWHILGAYLFIAFKLTGQPHPEGLPTYRSSKFLSDVSKYSHDKNGLNASAMIAHLILLHIEDLEGTSKRGGVVDRLEALDKYRQRHLPETIAPRSSLFIEILGKTAEFNFNANLLLDTSIANDIDALRKMSSNDVAQPFELEVIPYDNLLDLLFSVKKSKG
jgi:hypothetical protein